MRETKDIIELVKGVKVSPTPENINFDPTKLIETMAVVCHHNHKSLLLMLKGRASGFKQRDGTYALFASTMLTIDELNGGWEELSEENKNIMRTWAKRILLAIITEIE